MSVLGLNVRLKAAAPNFRDLLTVKGVYLLASPARSPVDRKSAGLLGRTTSGNSHGIVASRNTRILDNRPADN
jgi:hypothetical protein